MDRFWDKVDKTGDCWLWVGATSGGGYGNITINKEQFSTHRLSYEMHYGAIPNGKFVCHKCDTPNCVNPDHLFIGSPLKNMQDKMQKGRHVPPSGEINGGSKLIEEDVRRIREARLFGASQKDLAKIYNVLPNAISRVVNRKRWAHVE